MANTGPREQRWLPWAVTGLAALLWVSLVGVVQPTGVIEVAAMVAVALIVALSVLVVASLAGAGSFNPVRVRSQRRARPISRNWDADALGRPQPRAPGSGRSCD